MRCAACDEGRFRYRHYTEQIKPRCAVCDEGRFGYSRGLDAGTTEQIKPRCAACDEGRLRYSRCLDTGTTLNRSRLGVLLVMKEVSI